MRVIDGAAALSEFVAGYHGDCGETAELAGLHVIDPVKWPLNAATLASIVKWDISKGWAGMSGAEPLSSIAKDLTHQEIAFINHGYGEPFGLSGATDPGSVGRDPGDRAGGGGGGEPAGE